MIKTAMCDHDIMQALKLIGSKVEAAYLRRQPVPILFT